MCRFIDQATHLLSQIDRQIFHPKYIMQVTNETALKTSTPIIIIWHSFILDEL
jgi:hypothetical protein